MDQVKLNESPVKTKAVDQRSQDLRVIALQCAVTGSSAGWNADTILQKAKSFEMFLLNGETDTKPDDVRQWAKAGEESS